MALCLSEIFRRIRQSLHRIHGSNKFPTACLQHHALLGSKSPQRVQSLTLSSLILRRLAPCVPETRYELIEVAIISRNPSLIGTWVPKYLGIRSSSSFGFETIYTMSPDQFSVFCSAKLRRCTIPITIILHVQGRTPSQTKAFGESQRWRSPRESTETTTLQLRRSTKPVPRSRSRASWQTSHDQRELLR
jgi:hypothetical protein